MSALILVVEDDPATRLAIQTSLEGEGYHVIVAADATEAQAVLRYEEIQAVVLDWMLGGAVDGMDLCRSLKGNPATSHLVVIMLTAKSSPARRREAEQAGVDVFLPKPFDLHSLLDALRRTLGDEEPATTESPVVGPSTMERVSGEWELREYQVGSARLQMPDGRLTHQGTQATVQLRRVESWILEALARRAGVVPHGVLRRVVQQHRASGQMQMGALRETVRQINQKLRRVELPELQAQRGIGYRWLAHVGEPSPVEDTPGEWEFREYQVGPARLQVPDGRLTHRDTQAVVQLRRLESWILEALAGHAGVVPHGELCRMVRQRRGGDQMRVAALRATVRRINQKLRQVGLPEIRAQRGVGYRWQVHDVVGPVADENMTNL